MGTRALWTLLAADVKAGGADWGNSRRKTSSHITAVIGQGCYILLERQLDRKIKVYSKGLLWHRDNCNKRVSLCPITHFLETKAWLNSQQSPGGEVTGEAHSSSRLRRVPLFCLGTWRQLSSNLVGLHSLLHQPATLRLRREDCKTKAA
jgi:hypothetical protein